MRIIDLDLTENILIEDNYIALGNFDGLHKAHTKIIKKLINKSIEDGFSSSILLFKEHTNLSLNSSDTFLLSSLDQKITILNDLCIDIIFLIDFNSIKNMKPSNFLNNFLFEKLSVKGIFVGFDYKFGENASGDVNLLQEFCDEKNLLLNVEYPVKYEKEVISSTLIKNLIQKGDLLKAENLLGRKYYMDGIVVNGKHLGSKMGFPTANISLLINYVLPPEGVYISEIIINNKIYIASTSLGKNATFNEDEVKIESHILDFNENIYNKTIKIRFIKLIRNMEKFDNIEDLKNQVHEDILNTRNYFKEV